MTGTRGCAGRSSIDRPRAKGVRGFVRDGGAAIVLADTPMMRVITRTFGRVIVGGSITVGFAHRDATILAGVVFTSCAHAGGFHVCLPLTKGVSGGRNGLGLLRKTRAFSYFCARFYARCFLDRFPFTISMSMRDIISIGGVFASIFSNVSAVAGAHEEQEGEEEGYRQPKLLFHDVSPCGKIKSATTEAIAQKRKLR